MADLATIYHRQGRFHEDEKITVQIVQLRKKVLGEEHPDTLRSKADPAAIHRLQEQSAINGQAEQSAKEGAISVEEVELKGDASD